MLIWELFADVDTNVSYFSVITFCSEIGKWTTLKSLSFPNDLNYNSPLVDNGMLHWLTFYMERGTVHGILAFDPFKGCGLWCTTL